MKSPHDGEELSPCRKWRDTILSWYPGLYQMTYFVPHMRGSSVTGKICTSTADLETKHPDSERDVCTYCSARSPTTQRPPSVVVSPGLDGDGLKTDNDLCMDCECDNTYQRTHYSVDIHRSGPSEYALPRRKTLSNDVQRAMLERTRQSSKSFGHVAELSDHRHLQNQGHPNAPNVCPSEHEDLANVDEQVQDHERYRRTHNRESGRKNKPCLSCTDNPRAHNTNHCRTSYVCSGCSVDIESPSSSVTPAQESDVRDDKTQREIAESLHGLFVVRPEPMIVISHLDFRQYLNHPDFVEVVSDLPRPVKLRKDNIHRGDFDLLIIHRKHGLIVGEIKSVGNNFSLLSMEEEDQDQKVAERITQSVKQLQKAETVLRYLVSDLPMAGSRVTKSLILPYVSKDRLNRILEKSPRVKEELCLCLDVDPTSSPSDICLTSDDVSLPDRWWHQIKQKAGEDPAMTDSVYLELVSRFAGPATVFPFQKSSSEPSEDGSGTEPKHHGGKARVPQQSGKVASSRSPRAGKKKPPRPQAVPSAALNYDEQLFIHKHLFEGHTGDTPMDCAKCGRDLAGRLVQFILDRHLAGQSSHPSYAWSSLPRYLVVSIAPDENAIDRHHAFFQPGCQQTTYSQMVHGLLETFANSLATSRIALSLEVPVHHFGKVLLHPVHVPSSMNHGVWMHMNLVESVWPPHVPAGFGGSRVEVRVKQDCVVLRLT